MEYQAASMTSLQGQFSLPSRRVLGLRWAHSSSVSEKGPLLRMCNISVKAALQASTHQLRVSHHESWKTWLLEERNWDPDDAIEWPMLNLERPKLKYASLLLGSFLLFLRLSSPSFADSKPSEATASSVETAQHHVEQDQSVEGTIEGSRTSASSLVEGSLEDLESLLNIHLKNENLECAREILEKMLILDPNQLEWKLIKAKVYLSLGNFELAREGFEEVLAVQPLSAKAFQGLLTVMQRTGESGTVLEKLDAALARAIEENEVKKAHDLRIVVGRFYILKRDYSKALEQFAFLVDEDPCNFKPHFLQGLLYRMTQNHEEAEKEFEKYRELCPKDYPGLSYLEKLSKEVEMNDEHLINMLSEQLFEEREMGDVLHDSKNTPSEISSYDEKGLKPTSKSYTAEDGIEEPEAPET